MDESERIEHVRPELTPGEALCAAIEAHKGNIFLKTSPLGAILPLVVAHVRATDRRLTELERVAHAPAAIMRPFGATDLQAKLAHVIEVAKSEGQL